jgi:hypothetical protein
MATHVTSLSPEPPHAVGSSRQDTLAFAGLLSASTGPPVESSTLTTSWGLSQRIGKSVS